MGETLWNMLWIAEEELAKKKAKKVGEIAQSQNLKIIWSTSCSKWNSMSFPDNLHICPVQCPGIFSLAAPPSFSNIHVPGCFSRTLPHSREQPGVFRWTVTIIWQECSPQEPIAPTMYSPWGFRFLTHHLRFPRAKNWPETNPLFISQLPRWRPNYIGSPNHVTHPWRKDTSFDAYTIRYQVVAVVRPFYYISEKINGHWNLSFFGKHRLSLGVLLRQPIQ